MDAADVGGGEEYKVIGSFGQALRSARARVARIDATRKLTGTSTELQAVVENGARAG